MDQGFGKGTRPAPAVGASQPWRPSLLPMLLLHPLVLLAAVWIAAVSVWALAPESVLAVTRTGERTASVRAFWYMTACLAAFAVASLAVSLVRPRRRLAHARPGPPGRRARSSLTIAKRIVVGAPLLGTSVWLARTLAMVGGPGELAAYLGGGSSIAQLKSEVTVPAQLPPITTLVHFTPGAVALLVHLRGRRGWSWEDRLWFLSLVAVTAMRAFLMAERLAVIGTVSAGLITYFITTSGVRWRQIVLWGLSLMAAAYLVWTFGEFSRAWRDSRPAGTDVSLTLSNYMSSVSYANVRLGAYVFTAIDNAIITVDHWPTQSFPSEVSPPLAAIGLARFEADAPDLYETKLNPEFTGFTMPGLFFHDAREFGVVLALVYGAFFGLAWRLAATGKVAAIVLYGSTAQIVIDSFRMTYLFDTQGIAAILVAAVVWLAPLMLASREAPGSVRRTFAPRSRDPFNPARA